MKYMKSVFELPSYVLGTHNFFDHNNCSQLRSLWCWTQILKYCVDHFSQWSWHFQLKVETSLWLLSTSSWTLFNMKVYKMYNFWNTDTTPLVNVIIKWPFIKFNMYSTVMKTHIIYSFSIYLSSTSSIS